MTYRVNTTDIRSFWVNSPKFFATYSINNTSAAESIEEVLASVNIAITLSDYLPLAEGIYIRNTTVAGSGSTLQIYLNSSDIGSNRYLIVPSQEQVFISIKDPSEIYVTTTSATSTPYSIIAY